MRRKRVKLLKSLIAIVTAISINACCLTQAYALPEPSPDWWQAATVIVGGAAAKGTAVVSAPVVIGSVVVALGVCAGAWAITHPDDFADVINGVKSRISNLLVGKDDSGMLVQMDEGVPYLDEDSLEQIAQALDEGGYLSGTTSSPGAGDMWQPSTDDGYNQTYTITSLASVNEVIDWICSEYLSRWSTALSYDNDVLQHIYTVFPYLQNGKYTMFILMNSEGSMIASMEVGLNSSVSFPVQWRYLKQAGLKFVDGNIIPNGTPFTNYSQHYLGINRNDYLTYFTNINGSWNVDYGKTDNAVQVDGDTVTIPEWAGDIKETINELGDTIKNYPIALPSGTAIPFIFPDTTPEADIKTMVQDVPIPEDKPIPDIAEEGRTQEEVQNPDPDKPIETLPEEPLTESTLPSLKLPAALAQRFPFSLVSDINVLISKLSGTGEAPHFSIPVKIDIANIDTSIDVDLSMFSGAVSVIRPVILACAVLGIIRLTFKVINV